DYYCYSGDDKSGLF
nr:immunoglobulin light chain junction region [Macaca mulatta]MOV98201.1 immunoglobulin light chain junction region [Macaca mulatta]MOV98226.1 immunoglobulin light chain junction region [Macaca mulatta]MOV98612.1 immunoglobulin light chain junction region [Macaca mulatta]MOV99444.1 immunoglobulin light chain junction region [Macaca mulatta]